MSYSDSLFMQIALNYAWQFQILTLPNPAVGALILWKNTIIALQAHKKAGMPHAEVLACKEAFLYLLRHDTQAQEKILLKHGHTLKQNTTYNNILQELQEELENLHASSCIHDFIKKYHSGIFCECDFFVTLEPCNHYGKTPPCAELIEAIKPHRIIIGHRDETPNAKGGTQRLTNIQITQNILHEQSKDLLYPFLQTQANNGSFTLFKIAHRLDGSYTNGVISNLDSRIFTHNMRCIADYIIISGETLRNDNPLLDMRFALPLYKENATQPKIIILSKNITKKDIQDFRIANKDVIIIDCITKIPQNGLKIIEGGFNFLHCLLNTAKNNHATSLQIDCIMGYIAPHLWHDNTIMQNIHSLQLQNFYLAQTLLLKDFFIKQYNQQKDIKDNKDIKDAKQLDKNILYYLFPKPTPQVLKLT